jgi:hypothetical protein
MNGPELGDPDYDASAFRQGVFGGRFRCLATLAAIGSALLVAGRFLIPNVPDIPYPIRLSGTSANVAVIPLLVCWSFLAAINWRSYVVARRREVGFLCARAPIRFLKRRLLLRSVGVLKCSFDEWLNQAELDHEINLLSVADALRHRRVVILFGPKKQLSMAFIYPRTGFWQSHKQLSSLLLQLSCGVDPFFYRVT